MVLNWLLDNSLWTLVRRSASSSRGADYPNLILILNACPPAYADSAHRQVLAPTAQTMARPHRLACQLSALER